MSSITERQYEANFVVSEAPGNQSRENITVKSGASRLAGDVITFDATAGTITGAALGTNTGNGTIGTLSVGAGAREGTYVASIIEPGANLGTFQVEGPDGAIIGDGVVGTEFSGEIVFTISDGSTDFVAGDAFIIKVTVTTEKAVVLPNDGTKEAEGILLDKYDATSADVAGVALVRNCEVNGNEVNWPSGISAANKDLAITQLRNRGILVRT